MIFRVEINIYLHTYIHTTFDFQLSARALAMQTCPFIYNVDKISAVRIHLPSRHLRHNLFHAIK